jgi:hypothetical protein
MQTIIVQLIVISILHSTGTIHCGMLEQFRAECANRSYASCLLLVTVAMLVDNRNSPRSMALWFTMRESSWL